MHVHVYVCVSQCVGAWSQCFGVALCVVFFSAVTIWHRVNKGDGHVYVAFFSKFELQGINKFDEKGGKKRYGYPPTALCFKDWGIYVVYHSCIASKMEWTNFKRKKKKMEWTNFKKRRRRWNGLTKECCFSIKPLGICK